MMTTPGHTAVRDTGPTAEAPGDRALARVVVSMDEVRVTFRPEPERDWSVATDPDCESSLSRPSHSWSIHLPEARIGPRWLGVFVSSPCAGRPARSLDEAIAAGRVGIAVPGLLQRLQSTPVEAFVRDGSVVLVLRDSTAIVDLFGLRPAQVRADRWNHQDEADRWTDTVPVEYAAPPLPSLDSAFLAEAADLRLAWETGIRRTRMQIGGWDQDWQPLSRGLWIVVGDSIHVHVEEVRCVHDVCSGRDVSVPDSAWSVDDPAVATLAIMDPRPDMRSYALGEVHTLSPIVVTATAPGRTRIRVSGIPPQEGAPPSSIEVRSTAEAEVVVTERPAGIELLPRFKSASLGEWIEFRTLVTGVDGNPVEGAPVQLVLTLDGQRRHVRHSLGAGDITFDSPGVWTLIAALGPFADTLRVTVEPPGLGAPRGPGP